MTGTAGKQAFSVFGEILANHREDVAQEWIREMAGSVRRGDLLKESELRSQSSQFLDAFAKAFDSAGGNLKTAPWDSVRELLKEISASRSQQGFSPSETASFIFSLKRPLFERIREGCGGDPKALAAEFWTVTELLDSLGLYTAEVFMKSREAMISRQQEEMLELSTPVVKLWDGILALPLIGTLDSARTEVVMENLLQSIVQSNSKIAIIDITGVPTVDTIVAQHLLKTVTAARLMGADCIISGVRPQIAQTIVHLGINLLDITTKATLSDAFAVALHKTGATVVRKQNSH
jgi:rsbT co-antagonist protein RsbR